MENKKGITILIIILVVIILGLSGFIALDKFVLNKSLSSSKTTIDDVDIDINSFYQIADVLNKFDNAFGDPNSTYLGYPYVDKKLAVEDFDPGAALYVSAYSELVATNTPQYLSANVIKGNFEKMFGKKLKFENKSIDAGDLYKLKYNKETATYTYTLATPKLKYSPGYYAINTKTRLEDDKIIVTRKVFYVEYATNNETGIATVANIYSEDKPTTKIGAVDLRNGIINENEVIAKYGSKLKTYDVTFKYNKGIEYNLYLIQRIK